MDRVGTTAVIIHEQYDKGIKSLLTDRDNYMPLYSNPTEHIKEEIDAYIEITFSRGWITDK